MRIDKYLCDCGVGTRKEVKEIIKNGRVRVNDKHIKTSSEHIDENAANVYLDEKKLTYVRFIYLMLNKPMGVVSATYDKKLQTVIDLVDEKYLHFDLFPVGRLDIDTTGLLILTNDGEMAHRLTSPKHHADKTYYATIEGVVDEEDIQIFYDGVRIHDGYICKSAKLEIIKSDDISEILLTIQEGKFHQVKRMFEAVGKKVLTLKRVSMGDVELDENLALGEMRELTAREIEILKSI